MDAIQKDVDQEVKEVETESPILSEHQSELERIAQMVQEGVIRDDDENQQEHTPSEEQDFSNPLTKKSDEWYVTTKVDGEEKDVLWNDVLTQYQKNSSADKRLQEASDRQRELVEYETKLNAYRSHLETQARQPSSDAGEEETSPSSDATDALYEQYHDALFQGDETKASGLLKKIRVADRPSTPEIDVNSIVERTKAEMREEEKEARERGYETRRKDAVQMFHNEYPDISGDPSLLAVADRRSAELYSENPTRDPWDIMQECAEYSRAWINSYVEKMSGGPAEGRRTQRKQNMDEVVPRNVKASIGEDEVEQSYSDIIAEMKQGRGQPAYK